MTMVDKRVRDLLPGDRTLKGYVNDVLTSRYGGSKTVVEYIDGDRITFGENSKISIYPREPVVTDRQVGAADRAYVYRQRDYRYLGLGFLAGIIFSIVLICALMLLP